MYEIIINVYISCCIAEMPFSSFCAEIVPLPVVSHEQQLSCKHCHVSMQWKVAGYSNHTQLSVIVNEKNFAEYKDSISTAFDGTMLYTVNITNAVSMPAGSNEIMLCAQFDSEVMQESLPYRNCSCPINFTISSKKMQYTLSHYNFHHVY